MSDPRNEHVQHFLSLIEKARKGKLKVYIGMSAGVGKSYRMLQEAHGLQTHGVDVRIGFIETHGRRETQQLLEGLICIPRRTVFYKGKQLEEMDLSAILAVHPEVVIVDELAHTNVVGSKNEKRWQDVFDLIEAGINVITAVNIQHIESLHDEVRRLSGVDVKERIPDRVLREADEVVNIDLTADELIARLREGKIYRQEAIDHALNNFFKPEHILQLRELALKEVASQVERQVEVEVQRNAGLRHERFMACISSNEKTARSIIRKTARLAGYYNSQWYVLYVQTNRESAESIPLDRQRHLINNFKLATELGAEIVRTQSEHIAQSIVSEAIRRNVTTICFGQPRFQFWQALRRRPVLANVLRGIDGHDIDLIILAP